MPNKENENNTNLHDILAKLEQESDQAALSQGEEGSIDAENDTIDEPLEPSKDAPDGDSTDKNPDLDEPSEDIANPEQDGSSEDIANPEEKDIIRRASTPKKPPNMVFSKILIIFLVLVASIAGVYLFRYFQNEKYEEAINIDPYYAGIFVDNIHIGGLTQAQALDKITTQQKQNESNIQVTITYDEEDYIFYSSDVSISYDTQQILDDAYQLGRDGTNSQRYKIVMDLQQNNVYLVTTRDVDPSPIESMVRNIALSKAQTAADPVVEFIPDKSKPTEEWFIYSEPLPGIETDDEALWQSVIREFENETYGSVPVPKWEIEPTEDIDLVAITQQLISFKTVQSRNSNREHNIALCCSLINGTVLMPGEEFSMNTTTGERTKEAGFKEANTIVGGNELVPGIAGGVCQVSGTLFNAALITDLEITQRYHHSFELGYLKRGRDATVNYGTADLRFINNKDYPIYIAMYTVGLNVYAQIYGAPPTDYASISIWVKTLKTKPIGDPIYVKDNTVPVGSEPKLLAGHQGITCEVYKIYKDADGKTISSVLAYTDVYKYYAPELHVNPADYERYTNPTPEPTIEPSPTPTDSVPAIG